MKTIVGGHVIQQEGVWLGCVSLEVNEGRFWGHPGSHGTITVGLDEPIFFLVPPRNSTPSVPKKASQPFLDTDEYIAKTCLHTSVSRQS
jgi:hypothetical protein